MFSQSWFQVKKNFCQKEQKKFQLEIETNRRNFQIIHWNARFKENTLIIPFKYIILKKYIYISCVSLNSYTKEGENTTKKEEFTAKHRMFGAINLCQTRKFYTTLVVMVETFRRSAPPLPQSFGTLSKRKQLLTQDGFPKYPMVVQVQAPAVCQGQMLTRSSLPNKTGLTSLGFADLPVSL